MRPPALAVACAALVILPWAVRNADAFGRFIPSDNRRGGERGWRLQPGVLRRTATATRGGGSRSRCRSTRHSSSPRGWMRRTSISPAPRRQAVRVGTSRICRRGNSLEPAPPVRDRGRVGGRLQRGRPWSSQSGSGTDIAEQIALALAAALALAGVVAIVRSRPGSASSGRPGGAPHSTWPPLPLAPAGPDTAHHCTHWRLAALPDSNRPLSVDPGGDRRGLGLGPARSSAESELADDRGRREGAARDRRRRCDARRLRRRRRRRGHHINRGRGPATGCRRAGERKLPGPGARGEALAWSHRSSYAEP